jgi:hypothetical protein
VLCVSVALCGSPNDADEMAKKGGKVYPKAKVGVSVGTSEKGTKYAAGKLEKGPETCNQDNDRLIIKGKFLLSSFCIQYVFFANNSDAGLFQIATNAEDEQRRIGFGSSSGGGGEGRSCDPDFRQESREEDGEVESSAGRDGHNGLGFGNRRGDSDRNSRSEKRLASKW